MKINLPTDTIEVTNDLGEVLIDASPLDIYYTMLSASEKLEEAPMKDKMVAAASALSTEYGCTISWGQAFHLFQEVDEAVKSLKKNTMDEQESLVGTT